jgi:hypothetical protein
LLSKVDAAHERAIKQLPASVASTDASNGPWGTRPECGGSVKMANFVCNITIYCRHGTGAEFAAELRSL